MEANIKFEFETVIEVYSPKDWKFQAKTTDRKLKEVIY